jgi:carboxyl-terminal processing protease
MTRRIKLGFAALFGAAIGAASVVTTQVAALEQADKPVAVNSAIPLEDLRTFVEVFDRVQRFYVEPVNDRELIEKAIEGMVSSLDPHSNYLTLKDFEEMQSSTKGEFGGLGIEVAMEDGVVKVVSPIDDTPASRAGLKPGDLIIRLDGQSVQGMSLRDAVEVMRGKPGDPITLSILRKGEDKPLEVKLVRAVIKVRSVKGRMLENGYAYLRISQFQVHTGTQLEAKIKELVKENKAPLKGLVLDLRNNPGGVLNASVEVVDAFVDSGMIVYTKGRIDESKSEFKAKRGDLLKGAPIVVLMNEGSASASEIVAGALQDHKRALIAGRKSFGKGSVQTLMELGNGAALKITTARYYTPSGRSIQAEGIVPDIELKPLKVELIADSFERTKEANLKGHLDNPLESEKIKAEKGDKADASHQKVEDLLSEDYELYQAVQLLKTLGFTR